MDREELLLVPNLGPSSLVCPEDSAGGRETDWVNVSEVPDLAGQSAQHSERFPGAVAAAEEPGGARAAGFFPESESDSKETWDAVLDYAAKGYGAGAPEFEKKYTADLERKLEDLKDQLSQYERQQNDILDHLNQKERVISEYEDQQAEIARQLNEKAMLVEEKERLLLQLRTQASPAPPPAPAPTPELEELKAKLSRYERQEEHLLAQIEEKDRLIEGKELLEKLKTELQSSLPPAQAAPPVPNPEVEALKEKVAQYGEQQKQILQQLEQGKAAPSPTASELEAVKENLKRYEQQQQQALQQIEQKSRLIGEKGLLEKLKSELQASASTAPPAPQTNPEVEALKEKVAQYEAQQKEILRQLERTAKPAEGPEVDRLKSQLQGLLSPSSAPSPLAFELEAMKEKLRRYEEQQKHLLQQVEQKNRMAEERQLLDRLKSELQAALPPAPAPTPPPSAGTQLDDLKNIFLRFEQQQKMFLDMLSRKDSLIEQRDEILHKIESKLQQVPVPPAPPAVPAFHPGQLDALLKERLLQFEHQQKDILQNEVLQKDLLRHWSEKDRLMEEGRNFLEKLKMQLQEVLLPLARQFQVQPESGLIEELRERVARYEDQQNALYRQLQEARKPPVAEVPPDLVRELDELKGKVARYDQRQRKMEQELEEKDQLIREEKYLLDKLKNEIRARETPPSAAGEAVFPACGAERIVPLGAAGEGRTSLPAVPGAYSPPGAAGEGRASLPAAGPPPESDAAAKAPDAPPGPAENPAAGAGERRLEALESVLRFPQPPQPQPTPGIGPMAEPSFEPSAAGEIVLPAFGAERIVPLGARLEPAESPAVSPPAASKDIHLELPSFGSGGDVGRPEVSSQPAPSAPSGEPGPEIAASSPAAPGGDYAPGTAGKDVRPSPAAPPERLTPSTRGFLKTTSSETAVGRLFIPPTPIPGELLAPEEPPALIQPETPFKPVEPPPLIAVENFRSIAPQEDSGPSTAQGNESKPFLPEPWNPFEGRSPTADSAFSASAPSPISFPGAGTSNAPSFGSGEPPSEASQIPRTMIYGSPPSFTAGMPSSPEAQFSIPLDTPATMPPLGASAAGPAAHPPPFFGAASGTAPERPAFGRGAGSLETSKSKKSDRRSERKRSVLLPMVLGGICLAGLLLFALSSNDPKRLLSSVGSSIQSRQSGALTPGPAGAQTAGSRSASQDASAFPEGAAGEGRTSLPAVPGAYSPPGAAGTSPAPDGGRSAGTMGRPETAPESAAKTMTEESAVGESGGMSGDESGRPKGRDYIADVSRQALSLVKKHKLSGRRGDISHWLEYSFVTPGTEPEWTATANNASVYFVEFRVKGNRAGADEPAARYIFEADLEKKTVRGINPNAKELLAGGGARTSLRSKLAAISVKKTKRRKPSGIVPLLPLPGEAAGSRPKKRKSAPAAFEVESPAPVMEGGDATFNNPAAP